MIHKAVDLRQRAAARLITLTLALAGTSCGRSAPISPAVSAPPACRTESAAAPAPIDVSGDWEVRWDRAFAGWQPSVFEGRLVLRRESDHWKGELTFEQSDSKHTVDTVRIDGERIDLVFRPTGDGADSLELHGWIRGTRIIGEMRWGKIGWTPVAARRWPRLTRASVDHSLSAATAGVGARDDALRALIDHADAEKSSAIVVLEGGHVALEMYRDGYDGGPLPAMSASKSIASLAIGLLIGDGKLSLDTTMGSLFPEWKAQGPKAAITVRQLLTHTSGLDPSRADFATETIRERARKAKLVFAPGSRFQYNNGAVDFLAVVVKQASGVPLDALLEARLFRKLDVVGATWMKDSEGTPRAAGELVIRPVDLAKLGQLMLDEGRWNGEALLPANWVARSIESGQHFDESCGLLWWREGALSWLLTEPILDGWRDAKVPASTLASARPLLGKPFATVEAYRAALQNLVGKEPFERLSATLERSDHVLWAAKVSSGQAHGFSARGWLGQTLVVLAGARVVGVRMRDAEPSDYGDEIERNAYRDFSDDLRRAWK